MKHASHNQFQKCFILKMDGHLRSTHKRFIDALKAALQLKDQYPGHDIKVRATEEKRAAESSIRRITHDQVVYEPVCAADFKPDFRNEKTSRISSGVCLN